jgi:hypothetical protein
MPDARKAQEHFYVEWRIDVYADSPEDAAIQARDIQLDAASSATVFHVARAAQLTHESQHEFTVVDVDDLFPHKVSEKEIR